MTKFIVVSVLLLQVVLCQSQDCQHLADSGDCRFYSSCMEERIPCGDSGYALNYGKRYCEAFEQCDGLYTTEVSTHIINDI